MRNRRPPRPYSTRTAQRWRCTLRPDAAKMANIKSEAIAWFKKLLGVKRLPPDSVEAF